MAAASTVTHNPDAPLTREALVFDTGEPDLHVLLVPRRIIGRLARHRFGTRFIGLEVPHGECAVVSASVFLGHVAQSELSATIPATGDLILLPEPDNLWLRETPRDVALTAYWRRYLHAWIDWRCMHMAPKRLTGILDSLDEAELDEARSVLHAEALLAANAPDADLARELAATWLELTFFEPDALVSFFPALCNSTHLSDALAVCFDVDGLLDRTRPPGAPVSPARAELPVSGSALPDGPTLGDSIDFDTALSAAERVGNIVRAAILRTQQGDASGAESQLAALGRRLCDELLDDDADPEAVAQMPAGAEWAAVLRPVMEKSRDGGFRREVRFLFDLQRALVEQEQLTTDVTGWIASLGERSIKRELPARRKVRRLLHVRRAYKRIGRLRLSQDDAETLARVLRRAVGALETDVRSAFRPTIESAFDDVHLVARNVPEQIARAKLVDELVDGIVERGFLRIGDLRDAISRNQRKLVNITRAEQLVGRDELLRLDKRLADELEGVYQRGEIYLRGLQRASSWTFGTAPGRLFTRFVALPFGGAYVVLEGIQHIAGPLLGFIGITLPHLLSGLSVAAVGVFLMGLIHVPPVRVATFRAVRAVWRGIRAVVVDGPRWFLSLPLVRVVLDNPWVVRLRRWVIRPALLAAFLWWLFPVLGAPPWLMIAGGAVLFFAAQAVLNSQLGQIVEEVVTDFSLRTWTSVRHHIVPGLFRFVVNLFKTLMNQLERALYAVDERLRYRRGQSQVMFVIKASIGMIWSVVTYVARIYITLLVEPQVNPIKHFPVVTVSHKIILPFSLTLATLMATPLEPLLGVVIANTIAGTTVFLLPGVFGFLVWELKENWKLYEGNRPATVGAVRVGSHGETMAQLLRPGFHSGTVPKIYAKMRRTGRKGRRRDMRATLRMRADLHHVADAVEQFLERELCRLVELGLPPQASHAAPEGKPARIALHVSNVALSSLRIRATVAVTLGDEAGVLRLSFEEHDDWLVGDIDMQLPFLAPSAQDRLRDAIEGTFRLAGVDLVRNELRAVLAPARFQIRAEGVLLLQTDRAPQILPVAHHPRLDPHLTDARLDGAVFGHRELRWAEWVELWSRGTGAEASWRPEDSGVESPASIP